MTSMRRIQARLGKTETAATDLAGAAKYVQSVLDKHNLDMKVKESGSDQITCFNRRFGLKLILALGREPGEVSVDADWIKDLALDTVDGLKKLGDSLLKLNAGSIESYPSNIAKFKAARSAWLSKVNGWMDYELRLADATQEIRVTIRDQGGKFS